MRTHGNTHGHLLVLVAAVAGLLTLAGDAPGLTLRMPVTPAYVKDHPKEFTVKAEKRNDGLVHFTITRHLAEQKYLVASLEVREGGTVVLKSDFPAYVSRKTAKYHFSLSPKFLANSHFELRERSLSGKVVDPNTGKAEGRAIPVVGGTNYRIDFADFAPK
jgi:hypothetical protein